MKYLLIISFLFLSKNISAQCCDSIPTFQIIEQMPTCVDCCPAIESYINNHLSNIELGSLKEFTACFEIDTEGKIQNTTIKGSTNTSLVNIVDDALKSVTTWMPARQRGVPIKIGMALYFKTSINKSEFEIQYKIGGMTQLEYNNIMEYRKFDVNFNSNSTEIIKYLHPISINSYIIEKLTKNRAYSSTYSNSIKTKKVKIEDLNAIQNGIIIIPSLNYKKEVKCDNCKEIDFGEIPTGKEIILIVTRNSNGEVTIYFEKFIFQGTKGMTFEGKEYSYSELNQRIKELKLVK